MGYLPQDHHGTIRKGTTAFEWLRDINVKLTNEEISGVLGRPPVSRAARKLDFCATYAAFDLGAVAR